MGIGNRKSQHSFAQTPSVNIPRSTFDRSSATKDTFNFDQLVPIFVDEVLPGDTMNYKLHMFARLQAQAVPVMDNMYLDFFYFFVPNRLVWNNWERFNGAQDDPGDSTDYLIPQRVAPAGTGYAVGFLADKFGIPTGKTGFTVNALPFRAYNLIWNEWFRDQNLQNSVVIDKGDGPELGDVALRPFAKKHDYFTSALPWPQKGPSVQIPLMDNAPIVSNNLNIQVRTIGGDASPRGVFTVQNGGVGNNTVNVDGSAIGSTGLGLRFGPQTGLEADLSDYGGTINELRTAFQMQSLFELDARGGTRYTEILLAHFGVQSPDFRLQRPEYLGGGKAMINTHPVAQTSATDGGSPQANLAAFGTSSSQGRNIGFTKSFVEHGYVIGLVRARADVTYQQGLNKLWSRETRFDFFWPKLQELGEQAILNKELVLTGVEAQDEAVFGYQERYAEYRYKPSEIHGSFRSTAPTSLDVWHLAQELNDVTPPTLSGGFIQNFTPIARVLAVTDEDAILFDGFHELKHTRPMMTYSTPASLGRF